MIALLSAQLCNRFTFIASYTRYVCIASCSPNAGWIWEHPNHSKMGKKSTMSLLLCCSLPVTGHVHRPHVQVLQPRTACWYHSNSAAACCANVARIHTSTRSWHEALDRRFCPFHGLCVQHMQVVEAVGQATTAKHCHVAAPECCGDVRAALSGRCACRPSDKTRCLLEYHVCKHLC